MRLYFSLEHATTVSLGIFSEARMALALIFDLSLDIVKIYLHTKNEVLGEDFQMKHA